MPPPRARRYASCRGCGRIYRRALPSARCVGCGRPREGAAERLEREPQPVGADRKPTQARRRLRSRTESVSERARIAPHVRAGRPRWRPLAREGQSARMADRARALDRPIRHRPSGEDLEPALLRDSGLQLGLGALVLRVGLVAAALGALASVIF